MKPEREKKKGPGQTYLERIRWYDVMIDSKLEELTNLNSIVRRITPVMKETGGGGAGGNQDKLGDTIAKIIDLQAEINSDVDMFVDKKREATRLLKKLENPLHFQILHKRYVLYKSFEQIAADTHYSYRNITHAHGRALQAFDKVLEEAKKRMLFSKEADRYLAEQSNKALEETKKPPTRKMI